MDRPKRIGGHSDVVDAKLFINRGGLDAGVGIEQLLQLVIVIGALIDSLLEYGRVACEARDAVVINQAPQVPGRDHFPADVVHPNRLAVLLQLFQWIHRFPFRHIIPLLPTIP